MKKYKVTVTRTDEYEISLDEEILASKEKGAELFGTDGQSFIESMNEHFWKTHDVEDVAKHLGDSISYLGDLEDSYEGFGYIKKYSGDGFAYTLYKQGFEVLPEDETTPGISVTVISYNDDREIDVEEITD